MIIDDGEIEATNLFCAFFFVKTCCLYYPQSNSTTTCSVRDSGVLR